MTIESNPIDTHSTDNSEESIKKSSTKKAAKPEVSASIADITEIAADLTATMPEIQQHAIDQENLIENEKVAHFSHLVDKDGNGFDPSIHKTHTNGEPVLTPAGKLSKKPGRKGGGSTGSASKVSKVSPLALKDAPASKEQIAKIQARASGTMTANLLLQIGIVAGGEEWHPHVNHEIGLDEKAMLENAFADYFEATGKTDIPPGMALCVAVGAYALPRFTMPKTQSRLSKFKNAIKSWYITRKIKKHGMKAVPAEKAQDDKKEAGDK